MMRTLQWRVFCFISPPKRERPNYRSRGARATTGLCGPNLALAHKNWPQNPFVARTAATGSRFGRSLFGGSPCRMARKIGAAPARFGFLFIHSRNNSNKPGYFTFFASQKVPTGHPTLARLRPLRRALRNSGRLRPRLPTLKVGKVPLTRPLSY